MDLRDVKGNDRTPTTSSDSNSPLSFWIYYLSHLVCLCASKKLDRSQFLLRARAPLCVPECSPLLTVRWTSCGSSRILNTHQILSFPESSFPSVSSPQAPIIHSFLISSPHRLVLFHDQPPSRGSQHRRMRKGRCWWCGSNGDNALVSRGGSHGGWGGARTPMANGRQPWSWWRLGDVGRGGSTPLALSRLRAVRRTPTSTACWRPRLRSAPPGKALPRCVLGPSLPSIYSSPGATSFISRNIEGCNKIRFLLVLVAFFLELDVFFGFYLHPRCWYSSSPWSGCKNCRFPHICWM
jgi:hypothetical protein